MTYTKRLLLSILAPLLFITGCSDVKQTLYEKGVAYQLGKAELNSKSVSIGNVDMAYLESSNSKTLPALILIHGLGGNKSNWLDVSKTLKGKFHIYSIDLPGHGDTVESVDLNYDTQSQADIISRFTKVLNIDTFHLAGHSMGGTIAAYFTARFPEKVLSLSLISPVGYYENWGLTELGMQVNKGVNPLVPKNEKEFDDLLEFSMHKSLFMPWPFKELAAKSVISNYERTIKVFNDFSQATLDQRGVIKTIRNKTLVLWGDRDRILPLDNAMQFGGLIRNSTVVILNGIGHTPLIEAPEETSRNILSLALNET